MTLGSTQPLTEMSTRNICWGVKAAGGYGWQSYHLHVPIVLKSGNFTLLEPSGPVQACNGIALPFTHNPTIQRSTCLSNNSYMCSLQIAYSKAITKYTDLRWTYPLQSPLPLASSSAHTVFKYRGADKSLARPGRKQATATEDFDVHMSYLLSYLLTYLLHAAESFLRS